MLGRIRFGNSDGDPSSTVEVQEDGFEENESFQFSQLKEVVLQGEQESSNSSSSSSSSKNNNRRGSWHSAASSGRIEVDDNSDNLIHRLDVEEGEDGHAARDNQDDEEDAKYRGEYGFGRYPLYFAPTVLMCLGRRNPIRRVAISVVKSKWFDFVVLLCIVVNSVMMALWDPVDQMLDIKSGKNDALITSELFFQPFFTLEAVIKIVALGMLVRYSGYFYDPWNILDFVIVATGWIPIFVELVHHDPVGGSGTSPLTVFRVARILRPLRTLRMFPALERLVRSILQAGANIAEVLLLCGSILVVFALIGLTLLKGKLRQHCGVYDNVTNELMIPDDEMEQYCSLRPDDFGRRCPEPYECVVTCFNPASGLVGFDNMGQAMLTVFQMVTLEGWSTVMYAVFDTAPQIYGVYFILLILFGGYFMINLLISALSLNYMLVRQKAEEDQALKSRGASFIEDLVKKQAERGKQFEYYNSLSTEDQVAVMEMRLMFSYEMNQKNPHYNIISKESYEAYKAKHDPYEYKVWRKRFAKSHGKHKLLAAQRSSSNSEMQQHGRLRRGSSLQFSDSMSSMYRIYESEEEGDRNSVQDSESQNEPITGRHRGSTGSSFHEVVMDQDQLEDNVVGARENTPSPSSSSSSSSASTEHFPTEQANVEEETTEAQGQRDAKSMNIDRVLSSAHSTTSSAESSAAVGAQEDAPAFRRYVYKNITKTLWFNLIVLFLITANSIILAMEHFGQPMWVTNMLAIANNVFLGLFTVEIILRFIGGGVYHYFRNGFNCLDFLVVVLGYIQLFVDTPSVSVLRTLRILRFLRFAEQWKNLGKLLCAIQKTYKQVAPYLVFLGIILYIFTIAGLHLYGGVLVIPQTVEVGEYFSILGEVVNGTMVENVEFDCTKMAGNFYRDLGNGSYVWHCPMRTNYDNFLWSFVTIFQVLTGEDWNGVMENTYAATGNNGWTVVFYIFIMLFGSFIVLNFFLAILLDTFIQHHLDEQDENESKLIQEKSNFGNDQDATLEPAEDPVSLGRGESLRRLLERRQRKTYNLSDEEIQQLDAFNYNSLCCITPTNKFRRFCAVLMHQLWFDYFIIFIIIASCILLALESPTRMVIPEDTLYILNLLITIIFTLEAVIKIVALGFVSHRGAYLRSKWNILDFVILVISIIDVVMATGSSGTHNAKVLRAMRALRPLRTIQRFEGLRIIVASFASAIIPCFQVLLICLLFYAMFSIVSVTFFGGKLYACYECPVDEDVCFRNYSESARNCMNYPNYGVNSCSEEFICEGMSQDNSTVYRWLNPTYGSLSTHLPMVDEYSFDNFFASYLALFEVSTMEMWMQPMYSVTDIVEIGSNPIRGSNDAASVYFVLFIFILQYFMLQVFVAVLINTYLDSSNLETGDAFMSEEQRKWVEVNRRALTRSYKRNLNLLEPQNRIRKFAFKIVTSDWFSTFIYIVILANTLWLMTEHFNQSETFTIVFTIGDQVFSTIYVTEAILKVMALGPRGYISSKGNQFDFVIVLSILINWILGAIPGSEEMDIFRAIEVLRVLRVFRLLKSIPALKSLLSTLILTIVPLANIMFLMGIVFFMFAVLGMYSFGGMDTSNHEFLGEHVNFDTFMNSFFVLFAMCTGESWVGIMRELSYEYPGAVAYCTVFMVTTSLIMLNLFVAVIMTNYTAQFEQKRRIDGVKQHLDENSFRDYNKVWNELHAEYVTLLRAKVSARQDRVRASGRNSHQRALERAERSLKSALDNPLLIPADFFAKLMLKLKAPLGFRKRVSKVDVRFTPVHVMKFIKDRPVPTTPNGQIQFHSTLRALIDLNVLKGQQPPEAVADFLSFRLPSTHRDKLLQSHANSGDESVADVIARDQIERMIRSFVIRWRCKYLKKNGASDETIRNYLVNAFVSPGPTLTVGLENLVDNVALYDSESESYQESEAEDLSENAMDENAIDVV